MINNPNSEEIVPNKNVKRSQDALEDKSVPGDQDSSNKRKRQWPGDNEVLNVLFNGKDQMLVSHDPPSIISCPSSRIRSPLSGISIPSPRTPSPPSIIPNPLARIPSPLSGISIPSPRTPSPPSIIPNPSSRIPSPLSGISISSSRTPSPSSTVPILHTSLVDTHESDQNYNDGNSLTGQTPEVEIIDLTNTPDDESTEQEYCTMYKISNVAISRELGLVAKITAFTTPEHLSAAYALMNESMPRFQGYDAFSQYGEGAPTFGPPPNPVLSSSCPLDLPYSLHSHLQNAEMHAQEMQRRAAERFYSVPDTHSFHPGTYPSQRFSPISGKNTFRSEIYPMQGPFYPPSFHTLNQSVEESYPFGRINSFHTAAHSMQRQIYPVPDTNSYANIQSTQVLQIDDEQNNPDTNSYANIQLTQVLQIDEQSAPDTNSYANIQLTRVLQIDEQNAPDTNSFANIQHTQVLQIDDEQNAPDTNSYANIQPTQVLQIDDEQNAPDTNPYANIQPTQFLQIDDEQNAPDTNSYANIQPTQVLQIDDEQNAPDTNSYANIQATQVLQIDDEQDAAMRGPLRFRTTIPTITPEADLVAYQQYREQTDHSTSLSYVPPVVGQGTSANIERYTYAHSSEHEPASNRSVLYCSICGLLIKSSDRVRRLRCLHLYHAKCIEKWVNGIKYCPQCLKRIDFTSELDIYPVETVASKPQITDLFDEDDQ